MKKLISVALCALLLTGCGGAAASSAGSESTPASSAVSSEAASSDAAQDSTPAAEAADLDGIVAALEAVNPIANPRALDDFSVQNELLLTMDNIEAYKGDVTNDQADCGLVFAVQAKPGKAADVEAELNAYKDSLAANDLYAEFADKVAQAKDARIVSKGDCVVLVIAGVGGPDYADIDTAIAAALN
mgnify:FL=1